jgi:hypothetical protein
MMMQPKMISGVSLWLFVLAALSPLPVSAIERINTEKLPCAVIQQKLIEDGAAILRHTSPRGVPLYDRYVSDSRMCEHRKIGQWARVPAKDTPRCRVIACKAYEPDDVFPHSPFIGPWLRLRVGA